MAADNEKKTLDYGAFLADLEAKRSALDQAIASLKAVMAAGSTEGMSFVHTAVSLVNPVIHGGEIPAGAFHGMSIPEATKLYLSIVKKKQTTKEIAAGLQQGGMESRGKNFETIVGTGLYRAARSIGEVLRVKGAWGLAEWWPAGVRTASQERPKGRKAKKPRKQKLAKAANLAEAAEVALQSSVENNGRKKPQQRIAEFLRSNPTKIYTPQEVSRELGIKMNPTTLTLGRLAAKNVVEKIESGKYRAAHG